MQEPGQLQAILRSINLHRHLDGGARYSATICVLGTEVEVPLTHTQYGQLWDAIDELLEEDDHLGSEVAKTTKPKAKPTATAAATPKKVEVASGLTDLSESQGQPTPDQGALDRLKQQLAERALEEARDEDGVPQG